MNTALAIEMHGIVTVESLPTGYYSFAWSRGDYDYTELVHPWNVARRLAEINAAN